MRQNKIEETAGKWQELLVAQVSLRASTGPLKGKGRETEQEMTAIGTRDELFGEVLQMVRRTKTGYPRFAVTAQP